MAGRAVTRGGAWLAKVIRIRESRHCRQENVAKVMAQAERPSQYEIRGAMIPMPSPRR